MMNLQLHMEIHIWQESLKKIRKDGLQTNDIDTNYGIVMVKLLCSKIEKILFERRSTMWEDSRSSKKKDM